MIEETCVAEFTHFVLILLGFYALRLWPGTGGAVVTAIYILFGNLPFLIIQRYNRPRLQSFSPRSSAGADATKKNNSKGSDLFMKVLILSCNTGEGHNSCAAALAEECRFQNIPCDTEDALRFISPEVSRFISNWHVRIYRHAPGLFRVGYRAAETIPHSFTRAPRSTGTSRRGRRRSAASSPAAGTIPSSARTPSRPSMVSEAREHAPSGPQDLLHRNRLHLLAQREGQLARPLFHPRDLPGLGLSRRRHHA